MAPICHTWLHWHTKYLLEYKAWVLYMSFDEFLLAVESRDLSQADKSIIRVSSFPNWIMSSGTSFSVSQKLRSGLSAKWMHSILSDLSLTRKTEKNVYFSILQIKLTITSILPSAKEFFIIQKFATQFFSAFLVRDKSERIEKIHFTENSGLSCWETEKEALLPIIQLWKRRH